jgi:DNA-binding NtrC family response regulator
MAALSAEESDPKGGGSPARFGTILLVEDNMLIALDTKDALLSAGAGAVVAVGNADAALAELARARPDFAVLDFNLGGETSERVAEALAAAGVPFCYATGYGEAIIELATQPPCGILRKPYSHAEIFAMLERAAGM